MSAGVPEFISMTFSGTSAWKKKMTNIPGDTVIRPTAAVLSSDSSTLYVLTPTGLYYMTLVEFAAADGSVLNSIYASSIST